MHFRPETSAISSSEKSDGFDATAYWRRRYQRGGVSGSGSAGLLAAYKLGFLNMFFRRRDVSAAIDLGCGDGAQVEGLAIRHYLGVDVSEEALERCRIRHRDRRNWRFVLAGPQADLGLPRGAALSLDVVYHLTDDEVFEDYMRTLFRQASRYVVVYSSDWEGEADAPHVRHRWHSGWAARHAPEWRVIARPANPYPFDAQNPFNTTFASFTVFGRD